MWHFLCSLLRCTPTHSVCCCGLALPCLMFGANECLWRSFHKQTNNSDTEFMQAFLYTQSLPQRSALQTRRAHAHTTLFARQTKQRNTLHECRVCNLYIFTYAWVHTHISVSCFKATAALKIYLCSLLHTLYTHVCPVVKKHSFSPGGFCSPNPLSLSRILTGLHSADNKVFVLFFIADPVWARGVRERCSLEGIRMSLYESL